MKKQDGFSSVEGLIIIVIVAVIGFAGYTVLNKDQDNASNEVNTEQRENSTTDGSEPDADLTNDETSTTSEVSAAWSCTELNIIDNTTDAYFIDLINKVGVDYRNFEEIDSQTYLGTSCESDSTSVVSFSHASYGESGGGPKLREALIGLAVVENDSISYIIAETPCVPGPPDATAPFSLVNNGTDSLTANCAGLDPSVANFEFTVSSNTIQ